MGEYLWTLILTFMEQCLLIKHLVSSEHCWRCWEDGKDRQSPDSRWTHILARETNSIQANTVDHLMAVAERATTLQTARYWKIPRWSRCVGECSGGFSEQVVFKIRSKGWVGGNETKGGRRRLLQTEGKARGAWKSEGTQMSCSVGPGR